MNGVPTSPTLFLPKDPLESNPCPLCVAPERETVLARRGYPNGTPVRNVICHACGLIRISPRMSKADYDRFYQEAFFDYLDPYHRPAYVAEIENTTKEGIPTYTKTKILPYIEPYIPTGARVLDIGAGFGSVLYLLKKSKQIQGIGLEPDPGSRQVAKEKIGIELRNELIEDYLERSTETFDFIFMEQVFEHLLDPLMVLKKLAERLTDQGVIYIGVPNAYNPMISMSIFYQLAHTFNYTPYTLDLFARQAGLKIIDVRDPYGYPLEVLLAKKGSAYAEAPAAARAFGSSWKEVYFILKRKRFWNLVRGAIKHALATWLPTQTVQKIRVKIDQLLRFRY